MSYELTTVLELTSLPTYGQIRQLEAAIKTLPPVDAPVTHHFAEGIYGRELFIPAGSVLTGKMHRHSTLNVLAKGTIRVTGPEGMQTLSAPAIFVSPPMCKKVGLALTDVVWLNVHPTEETDLEVIEGIFIAPEEPLLDTEVKTIQENP